MTISSEEIYMIAKDWQAEMSPAINIRWVDMEPYNGMWVTKINTRPSVLDALILQRASNVPGYVQAASAATGLSYQGVESFQKIMFLGHPRHETPQVSREIANWRGIITALEVYDLAKNDRF